jgi:Concanavalin A-like lectin/glucanases superfamily/FecR protein
MNAADRNLDALWVRYLAGETLTPLEEAALADSLEVSAEDLKERLEDLRTDRWLRAMLSSAQPEAERSVAEISQLAAYDHSGGDFAARISARLHAARGVRRRRWTRWVGMAAALAVIPAWYALRTPPGAPRIAMVAGEVQVERAGLRSAAKVDATLQPNDVLVTGSGGSATILWGAETPSHITLRPSSRVSFADTEKGRLLTLQRGTLDAEIARQSAGHPMILTTPHVRGEVLGTRFEMSAREATSEITVSSGRVAVSQIGNDRSQVVDAGERVETSSEGELKRRDLSPAERLNLGLIAWWPMDEGEGSISRSRIEPGIDLTVPPDRWVREDGKTGIRTPGPLFDGSPPIMPVTGTVTLPGSFTICQWMRKESLTSMGTLAANSRNGIRTDGFRWVCGRVESRPDDPDESRFYLEVANGLDNTVAESHPVAFVLNHWHHTALAIDGKSGRAEFYFDGNNVTSIAGVRTDFNHTAPLSFGALLGKHPHYFAGTVEDVRLYSRALADSDIRLLASGGQPTP